MFQREKAILGERRGLPILALFLLFRVHVQTNTTYRYDETNITLRKRVDLSH